MSWILENWVAITAVVLAIVRVLESIVQMTPTPKDNTILDNIKKFLSVFFKIS